MTDLGSDNLGARATRSAAWLFGRQFATNLVRLIAVAVLARHLSPQAFGVVALATVLLGFVTLVAEGGIGAYVIYYPGSDWKDEARSAFWLNLALTVVQLVLCGAAIVWLPSLFPGEDLRSVFLALAALFFMRQLAVVPEAILHRSLQFATLVKRDVAISVATAIGSIVLAVNDFGVWSLVIPNLVFEPFRVFVAIALAKWTPGTSPQTERWRRITRYTFPLMGENILRLVLNDGDTFVVGSILGTQSLGYYNLGWQLSNLVGRNVTTVIGTVAMPALSMASGDLARFQRGYLRMLTVLSSLAFPILLGMMILADDLVMLLYGPGWEPVVDLLRIFIAFTAVRAVTSPIGAVFNAMGKPSLALKLTAATIPFYLAGILLGSTRGAIGVAIGVALVRVAGALAGAVMVNRLLELPNREAARAAGPSLLAAIIMAVVLLPLRELLEHQPAGIVVSAGAVVGALVYVVNFVLVGRSSLREVGVSFSEVTPRLSRWMVRLAERSN